MQPFSILNTCVCIMARQISQGTRVHTRGLLSIKRSMPLNAREIRGKNSISCAENSQVPTRKTARNHYTISFYHFLVHNLKRKDEIYCIVKGCVLE